MHGSTLGSGLSFVDMLKVEEVLNAFSHVRGKLRDVDASHGKLPFSVLLKQFKVSAFNWYQDLVSAGLVIFEDDPSALRQVVK